MDRVQQHFDGEAPEFDAIVVKLIPGYAAMIEALAAALPFDPAAPVRAIDLGCGTGAVAEAVLLAFPRAEVTCVDVAANMIAMAQRRLARHTNVRYVAAGFSGFEFEGAYDAVVSSLALHHIESGEEKRRFYRRIFDALAPGGVFYNADVVLGSSGFLQSVYMRQWSAFMRRAVSNEEIENVWLPNYYAEDRPAKLADHLAWLAQAGFADVDVIWKRYNFAVFGGVKPCAS